MFEERHDTPAWGLKSVGFIASELEVNRAIRIDKRAVFEGDWLINERAVFEGDWLINERAVFEGDWLINERAVFEGDWLINERAVFEGDWLTVFDLVEECVVLLLQ